ncbi:hypothetical protein SAMD00019534_057800 [Acytostelium subglobosum LB1]|uniref:hypothetical protein n=1 Tax=Acytostelium subglobosum LB1 TaxID=1410327 RepID=UPI000644963D|nr:hypothetical protein SAMD00019534_057800 [Acytostelium subglobosum LB1]GAM22605.1 hypothetical protein SAMD00019534_057800 [Acytostelium subglobosum LB1]|eukprot:XP_012754725.1 hypothetical protein SAMD00019534_057800 [Acytostelium subglobosum LB1]
MYKNTEHHSSGSLYSRGDDDDEDDIFYDALETNPSWATTSNNSNSNNTPLASPRGGPRQVPQLQQPLPQSQPQTQSSQSTISSTTSSSYTSSISLNFQQSSMSCSPPISSSSSSTPNSSPSSSPTLSTHSLHNHRTSPSTSSISISSSNSNSSSSSTSSSSSSTSIKSSKRNSKVLHIIKSKKDELHHLFSSSKEMTRLDISQPQPEEQTPQLVTGPSHPSHESRLRKLLKRHSESTTITSSTSLTSSGESPTLSSSCNIEQQQHSTTERSEGGRVSRWFKSLHSSGGISNSSGSGNGGVGSSSGGGHHRRRSKEKLLSSSYQLVQTINGAHNGSIWAVDISPDGTLLATGGSDGILRVWQRADSNNVVQSSPDKEDGDDGPFNSKPIAQLSGHTGHILDIKWLNNHRLLTSSIDTKVKLWDLRSNECTKTFEHNDIVVSLSLDISESMFLTSTLDGCIRRWSIEKNQPIAETQVGEFITTINTCPQPYNYVIVTSHLGNVIVYNQSTLELVTKFNIKGKAKGPKITGVCLVSSPSNDQSILVSSDDSSIRQFALKDFKRICKYKGMHLENYQVKPTVSPDNKSIVIGSEDHNIYLWDNVTELPPQHHHHNNDKRLTIESCEFFTALNKPITATVFSRALAQNSTGASQGNYCLVATDTSGSILVYNKMP